MAARFPAHGYNLVAGQAISVFGDYAARTALVLFVLDRTGSAFGVGIMMMINSLPAIIGLSAGYLTARHPIKRLLVVYCSLSAFLSLAMITFTGDLVSLPAIYLVYFMLALMSSLFVPTRLAFVAEVIPKEALKTFNSLDQTLEAVVMSLGIVTAGYLYTFLGVEFVFVVNAVSFLALALAIGTVRAAGVQDVKGPGAAARGRQEGLARTFRLALANPQLLFLTLGVGASGLAVGVVTTMFVIFVRKELGGTNIDFSQVSSVRALVSSLVGFGFVLSLFRISERTMIISGYLAMGCSIAAMALCRSLGLVFLWNVFIGAANVLYYIGTRTLLQKSGDPESRTNLFALQAAVMRLCLVAGAGLSGLLADVLGLRASWELMFAAAIFGVVGSWGALALPRGETPASGAGATRTAA